MTRWLRTLICTFLIAGPITVALGEPPPVPDKDGLDDLISAGKKSDAKPKSDKKAPDKDDLDDLLRAPGNDPAKGPRKPTPADPKAVPPEPTEVQKPGKVSLPKYYDRLNLTDDQKERIQQVAEKYNPRINSLKGKIGNYRALPRANVFALTGMLAALNKLIDARQTALMEILTQEQKSELRALVEADKK
jgi:hypothetical protein